MTTVSISLSQATENTQNALRVQYGETSLAVGLDALMKISAAFSSAHYYYSSASIVGSTARINYSDGAYTTFGGVVDGSPGASSGSASATNSTSIWPNIVKISTLGMVNYNYSPSGFYSTGGSISALSIQTLAPASSSYIDKTMGNVVLSLKGNLGITANSDFSGVVTSVNTSADKFISSSAMNGTLNISGNSLSIGNNLASTAVGGVINSSSTKYFDGSFWNIDNATIPVTGSTIFNEKILAVASNFSGDDVIDINLPATVYQPWLINSGAGNDRVTLNGGGSSLNANLGSGNDTVILKDGGHTVDGGAGLDTTIFTGKKSDYVINKAGAEITVGFSNSGVDTLINFERIQFSDKTIALDINGTAGQIYRLYQAAFNRLPDKGGLGDWIYGMDHGVSLLDVSAGFIVSNEFESVYGLNPTNSEVVIRFYNNVLHRDPEQAGYDYWMNQIVSGLQTRTQVLIGFSESPENQLQVIGVIQNGIEYTEHVV